MKKLLKFLAEMNIGDTAEFLESPYANIRREEDGYYWVSGNGNYNNGSKENSIFKLAKIGHLIRYESKIIPKYVSFEEAMKARKDGKVVHFYPEEGTQVNLVHYSDPIKTLWIGDYSFRELIEGKWTIEE